MTIFENGKVKTICLQDHFVVGDIIIYKKFKKKSEKNTKTYKSVRFSMDYDTEYHGGQFGDFEIYKNGRHFQNGRPNMWKKQAKKFKKNLKNSEMKNFK